jgi:hypothetical protein
VGSRGDDETLPLIETAKLQGVDPAAYLRAAALADARGELLLPGDLPS